MLGRVVAVAGSVLALKAVSGVVDEVEDVVAGFGGLVLRGRDCCLVVESDGDLGKRMGERVEKV